MPLAFREFRLPVFDAHVHFFSHRFFTLLGGSEISLAQMQERLAWQMPGEVPAALADAWANELNHHQVERAMLIASLPGDEVSVQAAVGRHPERFRALFMVNPLVEQAANGVSTALARGRLQGVALFPAMHGYSLHDDRAQAVIRAAAEHPGTLVFVHAGVLSVGVRRKLGLPSRFDLRFSNPVDLHRVALTWPGVNFILPHFGAGYFREALMVCDLCPNVYLDTSSSNSWMRYEGLDLDTVLRRALDVAGPERLLFGTDSSFFPRGWHRTIAQAQLAALDRIGADPETVSGILSRNLLRLCGISQ